MMPLDEEGYSISRSCTPSNKEVSLKVCLVSLGFKRDAVPEPWPGDMAIEPQQANIIMLEMSPSMSLK
jgi:hypothetical protein